MKKKIFLFSAFILSTATVGYTVHANETGIVADVPSSTVNTGAPVGDTTLPQPTTGTGTIDNGTSQPSTGGTTDDGATQPSTGGGATQPSTGGGVNDGTTLPADGGTTQPSTGGDTTTPTTPTTPSTGGDTTTPSEPSTGGDTTTPTTPTTPSTGTTTPTENNPVITDSGKEIISTENGKVVIKDNATGAISKVAPEEIGAKANADGSISVKDKEGKTKVLPKTGNSDSLANKFYATLGMIISLFGMTFLKPNKNYRTF